MAFSDLLVHKFTSWRLHDEEDRLGQKVRPIPDLETPFLTDVSCRMSKPRGGKTFEERSRDVVEERHVIFCTPDTDIVESDWIKVTESDGTVLLEPTQVSHVRRLVAGTRDVHHLEVEVLTIRGGDR